MDGSMNEGPASVSDPAANSEPEAPRSVDRVLGEYGRRVFRTIKDSPEAVDKGERSIIHKITASGIDLDREVILPRGLGFSYLRKTHSVLFNHDPYDVVGKNAWIKTYDDFVKAKTIFADTERGREVFYLCSEGFINGWSIGMDRLSMKYCDDREHKEFLRSNPQWKGCRGIIKSADVLEYSVTPLPSNAEALTDQLKQGKIVVCKSAIERIIESFRPVVDSAANTAHNVQRIEPVVRRVPVTRAVIEREVAAALRLARGQD